MEALKAHYQQHGGDQLKFVPPLLLLHSTSAQISWQALQFFSKMKLIFAHREQEIGTSQKRKKKYGKRI